MTINEIIGNNKRNSKVDTELWKKMNKKYAEKEHKTTEESNPIETQLENKLKYNIKKIPKLELIPIENTAVNPKTQKEYDTLMQIYDAGEWKWKNYATDNPTSDNQWKKYAQETSIDAGIEYSSHQEKTFKFANKEFYQSEEYKVISTQEFYDIQNIKPETVKEINKWYDKNYPNRASKG
jgi:hypothetical protein